MLCPAHVALVWDRLSMGSSVSVCDTQWEHWSWLFSVYLPASPCSVPVLRKPVLQLRRPGRHNTTACERVGRCNKREWERDMRGTKGERDRETARETVRQEKWRVRSNRIKRKVGNHKRERGDCIADRATENKLRGPGMQKKGWPSMWTKEERATEKRGEGGGEAADRGEEV